MAGKKRQKVLEKVAQGAHPEHSYDKRALEPYYWWAVLTLILAASVARFIALEQSPPGFYVDEAAGAANIMSMSRTATSADGTRWPLFANALAGGYTTPVYLYFGALWVKVFGTSVASFRAIAAFFSVLTIGGIYLIARSLYGHRAGLLAALVAALSPWCFQFSRIAWDPPLAPCFLVWGLYFFVRSSKIADSIVSAVLMTVSMYSYPPLRAQVPLLVPALLWLRWKYLDPGRIALGTFCVSGILAAYPLLVRTLSGEIQGRYRDLSIFNPQFLNYVGSHSALSIAGIFWRNLQAHLSPAFLLVSGDVNLRHSSQFCGEMGWLDVFALGSGLALVIVSWLQSRDHPKVPGKAPLLPVLLVWLWGFVAGLIPAALTWEGLPHALRSIGAWPFLSLFCALVLWCVVARWRNIAVVAFFVGFVFAVSYSIDYFTRFPIAAARFFDASVTERAREARRTGNWQEFEALKGKYPDMALEFFRLCYGEIPPKNSR